MNQKNKYNTNNRTSPNMMRIVFGTLGCAALIYSGCAMCCGPYDYHYPTHGGSVERSDPVWGRVGSLFSDPGPFGGPSADYNLKPHKGGAYTNGLDGDGFGLEPLDGNGSGVQPVEPFDNGTTNDVLPPPKPEQRPGPDEATSIRRLRNQSQRGLSRWR